MNHKKELLRGLGFSYRVWSFGLQGFKVYGLGKAPR